MSPTSNSQHRLVKKKVDKAVTLLEKGKIICFPTETYYGIGVDPYNPAAVEKLFSVKKRDFGKAILLLVDEVGKIEELVDKVPDIYIPLMEEFWPGPLTLLFPASSMINPLLTGGTGNLGIRISSHPAAREICRVFKKPITATSANISGMPPAMSAEEAEKIFSSTIDFIFDGGASQAEMGSTIVGYDGDSLTLIRDGIIPFESVKRVI